MDDPSLPPPINLQGLPPPIPPMDLIPASNKQKHDDFYKYWDRFVRVKGKIKTRKESKGEGPSLDRDVEGRPGHKLVRSNTEGVTSRYVLISSLKPFYGEYYVHSGTRLTVASQHH
jgi:hypothetical protein